MGVNQVIIGLAIFIFFTIAVFFLFYQFVPLPESFIVIIAIAAGLGAEILYRKKS